FVQPAGLSILGHGDSIRKYLTRHRRSPTVSMTRHEFAFRVEHMTLATSGLHHVTAIARNPQNNADFYLRTLGLRLVKTTVNFDAPDTYHLYFGNESGEPGTLLTFFPFDGAPGGRHGNGQATTTAFSVPGESIGWWQRHLRGLGIEVSKIVERDGEAVLS